MNAGKMSAMNTMGGVVLVSNLNVFSVISRLPFHSCDNQAGQRIRA